MGVIDGQGLGVAWGGVRDLERGGVKAGQRGIGRGLWPWQTCGVRALRRGRVGVTEGRA